MPIWSLIGGLRGILLGLAVCAGTISVLGLYDAAIDDPAVRREARAGLVAVAQLEAAEAERDAQKGIAEASRRMLTAMAKIADQEADARRSFEAKVAETESINEKLKGDLDAILSAPADMACDVSGVFGRLRNH